MKNKNSLQFTATISGKLTLPAAKVQMPERRVEHTSEERKCDIALVGFIANKKVYANGPAYNAGSSSAWLEAAKKPDTYRVTFYFSDRDFLALLAEARGNIYNLKLLIETMFEFEFSMDAAKWSKTISSYVSFKMSNWILR